MKKEDKKDINLNLKGGLDDILKLSVQETNKRKAGQTKKVKKNVDKN